MGLQQLEQALSRRGHRLVGQLQRPQHFGARSGQGLALYDAERLLQRAFGRDGLRGSRDLQLQEPLHGRSQCRLQRYGAVRQGTPLRFVPRLLGGLGADQRGVLPAERHSDVPQGPRFVR